MSHNSSPNPTESLHDVRVVQLLPNTPFQVNPNIPCGQMFAPGLATDLPVVAQINASGMNLHLIDTRENPSYEAPFLLASDDFFGFDEGFVSINEGDDKIFGRSHHKGVFKYPSTVSRNHFKVKATDDSIEIIDLGSMSGTEVVAVDADLPEFDEEDEPRNSVRTVLAVGRLAQKNHFGDKDETAPYGYYYNYPIVGSKSRSVAGGVYIGAGPREAIVVDHKSNSVAKAVDGLVADMKRDNNSGVTKTTKVILHDVKKAVMESMVYDERIVNDIVKDHLADGPVGLSVFIDQKTGVCRHMGLLAALMLEKLDEEKILPGISSVHRNSGPEGAHAWAEYKASDSSPAVVIDPAQNFVGTHREAKEQGRWPYHR